MTRWCVVLGWAAILVATAGCSARSPHGTTLRADRDLLTQAELREHRFSTVFEAIEALRAHWLRERGPDSFSAPGAVQASPPDPRRAPAKPRRPRPPATVPLLRRAH